MPRFHIFFSLTNENLSDSGDSQAYYSRVAQDEMEGQTSLVSDKPPALKEHLYQNFDQVFLAMEQQKQPDLLRNAINPQHQVYVNNSDIEDPNSIIVNDEK